MAELYDVYFVPTIGWGGKCLGRTVSGMASRAQVLVWVMQRQAGYIRSLGRPEA